MFLEWELVIKNHQTFIVDEHWTLWFSQPSCLIYGDNNKEKLDSDHSKMFLNILVALPWSEEREEKNSDYTFLGDSWPSVNWFCLGECGACKKNK